MFGHATFSAPVLSYNWVLALDEEWMIGDVQRIRLSERAERSWITISYLVIGSKIRRRPRSRHYNQQ